MNYDEIYQNFVGKGKIQPIEIGKSDDGMWVLTYKEGKKTRQVECEDREYLDKILIEFGGKNPDTCRAPDMFLAMDGSWGSNHINDLGHRITKIKFSGNICVARILVQILFEAGDYNDNNPPGAAGLFGCLLFAWSTDFLSSPHRDYRTWRNYC